MTVWVVYNFRNTPPKKKVEQILVCCWVTNILHSFQQQTKIYSNFRCCAQNFSMRIDQYFKMSSKPNDTTKRARKDIEDSKATPSTPRSFFSFWIPRKNCVLCSAEEIETGNDTRWKRYNSGHRGRDIDADSQNSKSVWVKARRLGQELLSFILHTERDCLPLSFFCRNET